MSLETNKKRLIYCFFCDGSLNPYYFTSKPSDLALSCQKAFYVRGQGIYDAS